MKYEYNSKVYRVKSYPKIYLQVKFEHKISNSLSTLIPSSKVKPLPSNDNDTMTILFGDDLGSLYFMPNLIRDHKISPSNPKESKVVLIASTQSCHSSSQTSNLNTTNNDPNNSSSLNTFFGDDWVYYILHLSLWESTKSHNLNLRGIFFHLYNLLLCQQTHKYHHPVMVMRDL